MKRIKLYIVWMALVSTNAYTQCSLADLFPFSTGITKFQVANSLNLSKNVADIKFKNGYWDKPEYLKKDSIFKSFATYNYLTHTCIGGNNNNVKLSFADDTLYKMTLEIDFSPKELDKCLLKYKQLLDVAKLTFPANTEYILRNGETNEQIGEGHWLFRQWIDQDNKKYYGLSIQYGIVYERVWNNGLRKYEDTGKIEKYVLEVNYVDVLHTKYDRRGW